MSSQTAKDVAFISVKNLFVASERPSSWFKLFHPSAAPRAILSNVSFTVPQGFHGTVYGHEGAGKTVLLRTLTGVIRPSRGTVLVNGRPPREHARSLAAGYVSSEESEPRTETGHAILSAYGATHRLPQAAARISMLTDALAMNSFIHLPAGTFSTGERLRLNLARAALSDTPLVLLDDVADQLGADTLTALLPPLFSGRTLLVATRRYRTAERLGLPLLLLHRGTLTHFGTLEEVANELSCPRLIDVWIEGLRYDLLRSVRRHGGVLEARLIPSSQFSGQRLRITLRSVRYLPSLYDLISQAPIIQVRELPPSLQDIIARLT
ncbi:MAG: ATP-binding cassette domain-containing protein [Candidatus Andersenbacteria bacterium]|nr:ATP-binding cassette domain-containing protein [Candidatus Andersenbacteria bacterium]